VEQELVLVGDGGVVSRLTLSAILLKECSCQKTLVPYYLAEEDPDALGYARIREDADGGITILELCAEQSPASDAGLNVWMDSSSARPEYRTKTSPGTK
jgi:hypothetical protein